MTTFAMYLTDASFSVVMNKKNLVAIVAGALLSVMPGCSDAKRPSLYRDPDSTMQTDRYYDTRTRSFRTYEYEKRPDDLKYIPPKEDR